MPKISRRPLDSEHLGGYINDLWSALTLLKNKDEVRGLLKDLLTRTETIMLAKRIQIAIMLIQGFPYDIIKNEVKVQNDTIAKISNILNTSEEGYLQEVSERLINLQRKKVKKMEDEKTRYSIEPTTAEIEVAKTVVKAVSDKLDERRKKLSSLKTLPYSFGSLH